MRFRRGKEQLLGKGPGIWAMADQAPAPAPKADWGEVSGL